MAGLKAVLKKPLALALLAWPGPAAAAEATASAPPESPPITAMMAVGPALIPIGAIHHAIKEAANNAKPQHSQNGAYRLPLEQVTGYEETKKAFNIFSNLAHETPDPAVIQKRVVHALSDDRKMALYQVGLLQAINRQALTAGAGLGPALLGQMALGQALIKVEQELNPPEEPVEYEEQKENVDAKRTGRALGTNGAGSFDGQVVPTGAGWFSVPSKKVPSKKRASSSAVPARKTRGRSDKTPKKETADDFLAPASAGKKITPGGIRILDPNKFKGFLAWAKENKKQVVIDFGGNWCHHCKKSAPEVRKFLPALEKRGIIVVVAMTDTTLSSTALDKFFDLSGQNRKPISNLFALSVPDKNLGTPPKGAITLDKFVANTFTDTSGRKAKPPEQFPAYRFVTQRGASWSLVPTNLNVLIGPGKKPGPGAPKAGPSAGSSCGPGGCPRGGACGPGGCGGPSISKAKGARSDGRGRRPSRALGGIGCAAPAHAAGRGSAPGTGAGGPGLWLSTILLLRLGRGRRRWRTAGSDRRRRPGQRLPGYEQGMTQIKRSSSRLARRPGGALLTAMAPFPLLALLLALAGPAQADPALDAILPPDGTTSAPAGVPQGNAGDDPFTAVRQDILDQFHPDMREYVDVGDMDVQELVEYEQFGVLPQRFNALVDASETLWDLEPDPSDTPQPRTAPDSSPASPQPDQLGDRIPGQPEPEPQPFGGQPPASDAPIRGRPVTPQTAAARPGGNDGAAKADPASRKAPTPRTEEENRERQVRQADAQRNARDLADRLKKSLKESRKFDGGKEDALKGLASKDRALDGLPDSDPKRRELLLASVSPGFSSVFRDMKLKPEMKGGRLGFARADGSSASPAEIDALARRIQDLPLALTRYPDLFRHVSPAELRGLQQDYHDRPALRDAAFRDVALTEGDRDFVWSESCDKVSGECNENAKDSYKKGKYVPPKDLKAILASIPEPTEEEKALIARMAGAGGKLSGGGLFKGGLRSLLSRLFSGSPDDGAGEGVRAGFAEEGAPVGDGRDPSLSTELRAGSAEALPVPGTAPRRAGFPPPAPARAPRLLLAMAPGAAMLLGWLLWRRRRG